MGFPRRIIGLVGLLWVLLAPAAVHGAEISTPTVALEGHQVLMSFDLTGAFDEGFVDRIDSGLPSTIHYDFELLRDRKRWFDRGLQTSRLTVVGMYDAVRREYLVNYKLDGRLVDSRVVRSLDELERAMTRFERFETFTLQPLRRRSRLLVRVRAELGLRHLLWIIPSKRTTNWRESGKFRPPPDLVQ